jgi:RimJ/RimL family protein N-acetyltransferase
VNELLFLARPPGRGLTSLASMRLAPDYPVLTERLRLRPPTLGDVEAVHAYRSLPDVCRFVPFTPMTIEDVTERVSGRWAGATIEGEGDGFTLVAELKESGRVIGDVVLFLKSEQDRGGEVGWVFHPSHSGQGYATEAAHALLHLAFDDLGLHRVTAQVDSRNEASLRMAARLGMRREAHLVRNEWFKGEWTDEIDFAMLEDEWAEQHVAGTRWCGGGPGAGG